MLPQSQKCPVNVRKAQGTSPLTLIDTANNNQFPGNPTDSDWKQMT
jgi:hypothetical protein